MMSAAELRVVIEYLGIDQRLLAAIMGVDERTVRRWIAGTTPIPDGARLEVEAIEAATARAVGELVSALRDAADVGVIVHRTDQEMWAERPELRPYPARWWRMVVARAAHEIPGLEIDYRPT